MTKGGCKKDGWRIGISGSHCSGKSTLATTLGDALRVEGVQVKTLVEPIDVLRPLLGQTQPPLSADHIYYLLLGEHLRRLEQPRNQLMLYDRTLLDYAAYLHTEGPKNPHLKAAIEQLLPWYLGQFDLLFFLPVEIALQLDGKRPHSEQHRADIEETMVKLVRHLGVELIELRGSVGERTDSAMQHVARVTRGSVH